MALSTLVQWEVRTAGADTNGGGFKAGAAGTDRSQQNAAQVVIDNAAITATTPAANSNVLTFTAGYVPSAADVGNVVNIASGTNINAGFYEITSVGASTWTVTGATNLTTAGGAGSAIVGAMGGALATIAKVVVPMVDDNVAWVQNDGTYTITSAIALSTAHATQYRTRIVGYQTTRGDAAIGGTGIRPTVNQTAAANGITNTGAGWNVENFILDGAVAGVNTGLIGISATGDYTTFVNVKTSGWINEGIKTSGRFNAVFYAEVTNCGTTSVTNAVFDVTSGSAGGMIGSVYVHDNIRTGIRLGTGVSLIGGIVANNTGATSDGVLQDGYASTLLSVLVYGSGRDGLRRTSATPFIGTIIANNVFALNGGWGMNETAPLVTKDIATVHGNAYYGNGLGTVTGINLSSDDVDLGSAASGDPFVNGAGGDWRLNANALGGGLLRAMGFPQAFPGLTQRNAPDIGPYQALVGGGPLVGGGKLVG